MLSDVVVIGGGAIGVAAAFELAKRGAKVTLLERGPELASGCSFGSAGLLCPSHAVPLANPAALRQGIRWMWKRDSPFYVRPRPALVPWLVRFALAATARRTKTATPILRTLSETGLKLHAQYAALGLKTGFRRSGVLYTYETQSGFDAARRQAVDHAVGSGRLDVLDRVEIEKLVPRIGEAVVGGVYARDEGFCDSRGFVHAVGDAARDAGVVIKTGVETTRIVSDGNRIVGVETRDGRLLCSAVVVACGVWSRLLVAPLGIRLPLEGGKGYHIDLQPMPSDSQIPLYLQEARVLITPLGRCLRLAGTLELSGFDLTIDPVRIEAIHKAATRSVTGLQQRSTMAQWSGLRPCTPDGLPIIGAPSGISNLVFATGHGMTGVAMAPATGVLVAEVVVGERQSQDLRPFSPDRFN